MGEYKEDSKLDLQQIKDNRVYVESIEKKIGNRMHYDFMICRVDDSKPLLWAPFIYDSEEDALDAGKLLALRIQQQGF